MPAQLSVNINKYALLRNSRGHNAPDLCWAIDTCLAAGAHGITIHPRRDERHIRFSDVPVVAAHLRTHHPGVELNIECEDHPTILELVLSIRPAQCTEACPPGVADQAAALQAAASHLVAQLEAFAALHC